MFFCCNAKFGNTLINSNPKNFRYDLIWIKSSSTSFLLSKKMPMKKHELIYVFYRKLPYYDLSSHKHKFLGEKKSNIKTEGKLDSVFGTTEHYSIDQNLRHNGGLYDPPLPTSIIKDIDEKYKNKGGLYSEVSRNGLVKSETHYDPPLPTSIIKHLSKSIYGENTEHHHNTNQKNGESIYDPPLPNSILEIKSEKGKHPTQKPVTLIEWILKYYSKKGDTILDPTMGSGSSGVACNNMNRKYIGIELDETIFKNAEKRLKKFDL